jgi:predicted nucleic acid-binding protein
MSVVYDAGALVAAENRSTRLWTLHRAMVAAGVRPVVPVVVLAQVWRGGPQVQVARLLRACEILPDTEQAGRAAGTACGRVGTSDVVDALVVVTAVQRSATVVTSDPDDLRKLADALGVSVPLHRI